MLPSLSTYLARLVRETSRPESTLPYASLLELDAASPKDEELKLRAVTRALSGAVTAIESRKKAQSKGQKSGRRILVTLLVSTTTIGER
jgi:hypothetical protein